MDWNNFVRFDFPKLWGFIGLDASGLVSEMGYPEQNDWQLCYWSLRRLDGGMGSCSWVISG